MKILSYFTGAAAILLALYGIFIELIPYSGIVVMILFFLTALLRKNSSVRSGDSASLLQAQSNMSMNAWLANALRTDRKARVHFSAAISTGLTAIAIFFYIGSRSILTDMPNEMVLSKTSGTLKTIRLSKEGRYSPYHASLQMVDGDSVIRRFGTFYISKAPGGLEKFRALQPGNQLVIIYRADRRGSPLPSGASARIMEMHADGFQVWSLADSAAMSDLLKRERIFGAFAFGIAAVCSLAVAVFLYRKRNG